MYIYLLKIIFRFLVSQDYNNICIYSGTSIKRVDWFQLKATCYIENRYVECAIINFFFFRVATSSTKLEVQIY